MAVDLEIRDELNAHLLPWIDVNTRDMFGGACYLVKGKMFAIIIGGGVVMKLPQEHRQKALALPGVAPFTCIRGRQFGEWLQFMLIRPDNVSNVMPWLREAYSYVASLPRSSRKRRAAASP